MPRLTRVIANQRWCPVQPCPRVRLLRVPIRRQPQQRCPCRGRNRPNPRRRTAVVLRRYAPARPSETHGVLASRTPCLSPPCSHAVHTTLGNSRTVRYKEQNRVPPCSSRRGTSAPGSLRCDTLALPRDK